MDLWQKSVFLIERSYYELFDFNVHLHVKSGIGNRFPYPPSAAGGSPYPKNEKDQKELEDRISIV